MVRIRYEDKNGYQGHQFIHGTRSISRALTSIQSTLESLGLKAVRATVLTKDGSKQLQQKSL